MTAVRPALHAGMALREAMDWGAAQLSQSDAADPATAVEALGDSQRLLQHATGIDRLAMVREPSLPMSGPQAEAFAAAIARRKLREPVSRIMGSRGFYGRDFAISPAVLDPRPETETLIDAALTLTRVAHPGGAGLDILDIGTGSGCILLTLLAELPKAHGFGVDPSAAALAVAAENASRLGVATRARWVEGRGRAGLSQRFGLIVSNPPYIPSEDIHRLEPDVRLYDPLLALDGGPDGLEVYRSLAHDIASSEPPNWLVLEVGDQQAEAVVRLMLESVRPADKGSQIHFDMAGKARCVSISQL
jgi:release factor glutamine methyltransferase